MDNIDYQQVYNVTCFQEDIARGKPGELIFKQDFLDFLGIEYVDVTGCQQFQVIDTDYLTKIGTYEIKANYKDNGRIIIEDFTNINENFGPVKKGWFYKSNADLLIFISKATRIMIFIPFTENFKRHYEQIKDSFNLKRNRISQWNNRRWQSAFRYVPLKEITGYYSMYKKIIDC